MNENSTITVCGPGGPYNAVKECAESFTGAYNIVVNVIKSEPSRWKEIYKKGVDIFYGGAEYMLADFNRECPGIIDQDTIVNLYKRHIGIIVRKRNPLGINQLADLGVAGARILDVQLENMQVFQTEAFGGHRKIALSVQTGEQGKDAWILSPEIDAWITYRSWHIALITQTEFILIHGSEYTMRFTPIAISLRGFQSNLAAKFVSYLRTEIAHKIFQKYGWD